MLDDKGERLLSLAEPVQRPRRATIYQELSTSDIKFPTLAPGRRQRASSSARATTPRCSRRTANQAERGRAAAAHVGTYGATAQHLRRDLQRHRCSATGSSRRRATSTTTLDAALDGNAIPRAGRRDADRRDARRRRAVPALRAPAPEAARPAELPPLRRASCRSTSSDKSLSVRAGARARAGSRWRRSATTTCSSYKRFVSGRPDRRLRERRQAQRRLQRRRLRRRPVPADELQRHARRRVHARARGRARDAHGAVVREPARSSPPTTRSSSPRSRRPPTSASCSSSCSSRPAIRRSASCCCSMRSIRSSARSTRRCCSPTSSCARTAWSSRASR